MLNLKETKIDPYFKVVIDLDASSPNPESAVWKAQHTCVSEGFAPDSNIPKEPGEAVIKHQFKVKHWSVLNFAYVKLDFQGFPHDTVMQLVRHQGSFPLVQSMRYTGDRVLDLFAKNTPTEEVFYAMPAGKYKTRNGFYEFTEEARNKYLAACLQTAFNYRNNINEGMPAEVARRGLASGYRQNFTMAGTLRDVFHWLDQRTLTDTQHEAQILAFMALEELKGWSPTFFEWYEENRCGKNMLAP